MKLFSAIACVLLFTLSARVYGQKEVDKTLLKGCHDIQLGIGDIAFATLYNENNYVYAEPAIYSPYNWFSDGVYAGEKVSTGVINLSYHYQIENWFSVGLSVSYVGFYQNSYTNSTNKLAYSNITHNLAAMPDVRFTWLNKKYVKLYSGAALGFVSVAQNYLDKNNSELSTHDYSLYPALQIDFIGVSVGKDLYGFAKYGLGFEGFISAGIGYRFSSNK